MDAMGASGDTLKALQPQPQRSRAFVVSGKRDHLRQTRTRIGSAATVEQRRHRLQRLIGAALPLGDRPARPLDVRARTGVMPVEEQDTCPDVDRVLEPSLKIVPKPLGEQAFDTTIPA